MAQISKFIQDIFLYPFSEQSSFAYLDYQTSQYFNIIYPLMKAPIGLEFIWD